MLSLQQGMEASDYDMQVTGLLGHAANGILECKGGIYRFEK